MGKIEKIIEKIMRKPIPNDIEFKEIATLFEHYGCIVEAGGKHPKVVHKQSGRVITIAGHKKLVPEYNIKELKELLLEIMEEMP